MRVNPLFQRLSLLTGVETLAALEQKRVLVFGLGGVGSWCAEALVRSGLGKIGLIDSDRICVTNVNRQVQATNRTLGHPKVEALTERLLDINPRAEVSPFNAVFCRETAGLFGLGEADYVIDAIDSLTCKLDLIELCCQGGTTLFSSMGMARKLDPTRLKTADIWKTSGCPLARLVRQGLRKRGFPGNFTVVYSDERLPQDEGGENLCGTARCLCPGGGSPGSREWCSSKKVINGSAVTVTAAAGMILASLVLRDLYARRRGAPAGGPGDRKAVSRG